MGTQGTGRKRSTKKERATAEDDALNLIAREAEARLAAKRAARAEAREIRMKELERQQKEIFQVQKKYYGLNTKLDDRSDSKWGDIEQWMEDSERYSRSTRINPLSDEDERMSVGSRGSVRSDRDAVGAYGGGGSPSHSSKKSKKKKKHKHKDRDRNGHDDDYSVISSRSSRLSDESRVSRSSRLDLTSSRLSDDSRLSRASRLDLQPASYASSDLYSFNGLSSSRNPGSAFNGYQFYRSLSQFSQQLYRRSSLYEDSLCSGSRRATGSTSHPLEYSSYRSSGSRASSRASSARTSPVDNCGSVASFLRSAASSSGLPRDLDDVTIPDFSDVSRFAPEGGRGGWDVEDRDYLEKGSRAASALTATTLTSLGGSSSRRGSGETAITVDAESSLREIKEIHELKDQIQDVETKYTQNLKEAKDTLAEVEEKYRKAMVSNAQLDNEKNNLMYQVDTLKDSLMELEELLSESRREFEEKVKEFEREKHAHSVLQFQFNEMKETLKQSEELLNKHGIVLGPDLNVNGDIGETPADGSPSEDPASPTTQDSQTPTEGNSMLGNTKETWLRWCEDMESKQDEELHGESKANPLSSYTICFFDGESDVKDGDACGISLEDSTTTMGGETYSQDSLETDYTVEGCCLSDTKSSPQQTTMNKSLPDVSVPALADFDPQNEQDDTKNAENDKEEETPSKSQAQGAASGKKKKKKKKGKKKLGLNEDNQQKDKSKAEKGMQSATIDNVPINARFCCWPVTETLKELKGNQVKNKQKNKNLGQAEVAKPIKNIKNSENLKDSPTDQVTDEHTKEQSLEMVSLKEALAPCETIEAPQEFRDTDEKNEQQSVKMTEMEEATSPIEPSSPTVSLEKLEMGPERYEQDNESKLEEGKIEKSTISVAQETPVGTSETIDDSSNAEITEDVTREGIVEDNVVQNAEGKPVKDVPLDTECKEEVQTREIIVASKDSGADLNTDEKKEEPSLESEIVNPKEALAPSEAVCLAQDLQESKADLAKDVDDKEQALETSEVEEESVINPGSECSFGNSDLEDSMNAGSTCCPSKRGTSSEDNSDIYSTNTESEVVDSAESEVGSINDLQSEMSDKENTEAEELVSSLCDIPEEPESSNSPDSGSLVYSTSTDGLYDRQQSFSGSEQPSEMLSEHADMDSSNDHTPLEFSERGSEEETETVIDITEQGAEMEQEPPSPIPEAESSEVVPDNVEQDGDLKEPVHVSDSKTDSDSKSEGSVDLDPSPNDQSINTSDAEKSPLENESEPKGVVDPDKSSNDPDALDAEKSLQEAVDQSEHFEDKEKQTSELEDLTDESHVELSCDKEEANATDVLDLPDSPKEGPEFTSSIKQDQHPEGPVLEEDPDLTNSQADQQCETYLYPQIEHRHERLKDKSEDYQRSEVSSEPALLDSDEDDGVDEEGQSFDFDDLDMEDAIASNLAEDPNQISIVEGVEIASKESISRSLDLTQSNTDLSENARDKPVEGSVELSVDGSHHRLPELDAISQDTLNSWVHGDTSSENLVEEQVNILEEVGVTEEPRQVAEEGKVSNERELSEKSSQAASMPLEEGLDAVQHELKAEDSASLKSWDVVSSNTESLPTGRNSRKGSKKGKGKGKEDCKMS